jgi:oxygen-independent coproporphyrinogen III oxidase
MLEAMTKEMALRAHEGKTISFETLYFGGGTPSVLSADELNALIQEASTHFNVSQVKEITLELNPEDAQLEYLMALGAIGINRLSIGVQSLSGEILNGLNRIHDDAQALSSIENARAAGFQNISVDLIFGIPGQPTEQWKENVHRILAFKPEHLSLYGLTIEPSTVFGRRAAKGLYPNPDDEQAKEEMLWAMDLLETNGYLQYEVSNYCLPGRESRHNKSYWFDRPYLGIGPSAHSYIGEERSANLNSNGRYIQLLEKGIPPNSKEERNLSERINEYILTRIRTSEGIHNQEIFEKFKIRLDERLINEFEKQKLIDKTSVGFKLNREGILLADFITLQFMQ